MIGQPKNYKEYLSESYKPINGANMPYYVDMREMKEYVRNKGIAIGDLTDGEKAMFEHPRKAFLTGTDNR